MESTEALTLRKRLLTILRLPGRYGAKSARASKRNRALLGLGAGAVLGITIVGVNAVLATGPSAPTDTHPLDVYHTPPALVAPNQSVELDFDVVCELEPGPDPMAMETPCTPSGAAFYRPVGGGGFTQIPLVEQDTRRFVATVPATATTGLGFDSYVQVQDGLGHSFALPPGGANAPQHAWTVPTWTNVNLGSHAFGATQPPTQTQISALWGKEDEKLGLDSGSAQATTGPSAFDLTANGTVIVLDQLKHRLALFYPNGARGNWPINFAAGEGDIVIGGDGKIYVLDAKGGQNGGPSVSVYSSAGDLLGVTSLVELVPGAVVLGDNGPVVHSYPSEMWFPIGNGTPLLTPDQQTAASKAARPTASGVSVVAHAGPDGHRFALVNGNTVIQSWLVTSTTNLGEIQLAEPTTSGTGLLVVVRVATEVQSEFQFLRLMPTGITQTFSIDEAHWADSAALSLFRLRGGFLYQMRTSSSSMAIAKFDIGGA